MTDGLEARNGAHPYKNFKTNSPALALGLWWMARKALGQECVLDVEVGPPERRARFTRSTCARPILGEPRAHTCVKTCAK